MKIPPTPYRRIQYWLILAACCSLPQCVQTYVSPYKSPPTGYLVVEGVIAVNGETQYTLSRSIGLPGDSAIPLVTGARVQVEGSDSSVYPLPEQGTGIYGDTLSLNPALQYRLRITTSGGGRYLSDFVPVKPTPPIDSVSWTYDAGTGVTIYANTHDPNNATHYYLWSYEETWQYFSPWESYYVYRPDSNVVVARRPDQLVNRCWHHDASSALLIDNTSKLSQDVVYQFPLVTIPPNTQQLASLYSIVVNQYALTVDNYNFLLQMRVNTESLGSIFDVQPTELIGNIHSLSNPADQVIGYISACYAQQHRIFISYQQLPYWEYEFQCPGPNRVTPNDPDSIQYYFLYNGDTPIDSSASGYTYNASYCIDCTIQGGTTIKPLFWPN
jgi:hypothetical protein